MNRYQLTNPSQNQKTGPIPVSMTDTSSCPNSCSLKDNGCYAQYGPLYFVWRRMSEHTCYSMNLEEFCAGIRTLPRGQFWRHNQAGDLPKDTKIVKRPDKPDRLDREAVMAIARANRGRRGFTYTHYSIDDRYNREVILEANEQGFTINVSCETLEQADRAVTFGLPAVLVVPEDSPKRLCTPGGNLVTVCPATYMDMTCAQCELCQKQTLNGPGGVKRPRHIIGFPAHGPGKKRVAEELRMIQ